MKARPHQQEAIEAGVEFFAHSQRGRICMPCGSGKTFTGLSLANKLVGDDGVITIVVPTLALQRQMLEDIGETLPVLGRTASVLAVGSESDIGKDLPQDVQATTESEEIRSFLDSKSETCRVIVATYQSADRVRQAITKQDVRSRDHLLILDEAHRSDSDEFKVAVDIPSSHQLCLTATETRGMSERVQEYGELVYHLPLSVAISREIVADYRITPQAIRRSDLNELTGPNSDSAFRGAVPSRALLALTADQALCQSDASHAIVFSDRIRSSEAVRDCLSRRGKLSDGRPVTANHLDKSTPGDKRREMFSAFETSDTPQVLCNARVLTEGVNLNRATAVVLESPRGRIPVNQAIGRVLRNVRKEGKVATISIPLIVEDDEPQSPSINEDSLKNLKLLVERIQQVDAGAAMRLESPKSIAQFPEAGRNLPSIMKKLREVTDENLLRSLDGQLDEIKASVTQAIEPSVDFIKRGPNGWRVEIPLPDGSYALREEFPDADSAQFAVRRAIRSNPALGFLRRVGSGRDLPAPGTVKGVYEIKNGAYESRIAFKEDGKMVRIRRRTDSWVDALRALDALNAIYETGAKRLVPHEEIRYDLGLNRSGRSRIEEPGTEDVPRGHLAYAVDKIGRVIPLGHYTTREEAETIARGAQQIMDRQRERTHADRDIPTLRDLVLKRLSKAPTPG